jgi:hypothetical protein
MTKEENLFFKIVLDFLNSWVEVEQDGDRLVIHNGRYIVELVTAPPIGQPTDLKNALLMQVLCSKGLSALCALLREGLLDVEEWWEIDVETRSYPRDFKYK